ncbi:MAG: bifunctional demethylmenaquinone methyltransferase/2-methoxy-6-polyprenyl-1,4-benzoquinol methylase UbiE [Planctomycetota bacterium]
MPEGPKVRRMFAAIASRYDLLNRLLSFRRDVAWRKAAVRAAGIGSPRDRVLDICTGTGDLALQFRESHPELETIIGTDFCPEMVVLADRKARRDASPNRPAFGVADSLKLPFADASFDVVTVGFGIRNVADLRQGLAEMYRVLTPGGRAVVLEFSEPTAPVFRHLYRFYFHSLLPRVGQWLSKSPDDAYRYLPESVARFPDRWTLARLLEEVGFEKIDIRPLTLGIAVIHVGNRPESDAASRGSSRSAVAASPAI